MKQTPSQILLGLHLKELGFVTVPEYQFYSNRRWRFDLACLGERIGFECNGSFSGLHGPRWSSGDAEKMNMAQMLGWRVLVFSNREVLRGKAKEFMQMWLAQGK